MMMKVSMACGWEWPGVGEGKEMWTDGEGWTWSSYPPTTKSFLLRLVAVHLYIELSKQFFRADMLARNVLAWERG